MGRPNLNVRMGVAHSPVPPDMPVGASVHAPGGVLQEVAMMMWSPGARLRSAVLLCERRSVA